MRYLVRRLLHAALLLFIVSVLSFFFLTIAPGNYVDTLRIDPQISSETVSALRTRYGLDRPLPIQYLIWLGSVCRGEFGFSFAYGMPVGQLLWPRVKNTVLLTSIATALCWMVALPLGIAAALGRSVIAHLIRLSMSFLATIPDLFIGLALLLFAVRTRVFAVGGMADGGPSAGSFIQHAEQIATHVALPVVALVLIGLPVLVRHIQASVRESMASPFVLAARSFGIPRRRVLLAYGLRTAANPLISLLGFSIGGLVSSSLLVEVIMGWPGLGPLFLEAIFSRDIHIVIGATVLSALFLVTGNLIADFLLYAADPRIRQDEASAVS
jgi:peptide/nickel transport system permease protein